MQYAFRLRPSVIIASVLSLMVIGSEGTRPASAAPAPPPVPDVALAGSLAGWSGAVRVRTSLPAVGVDLPLEWTTARPEFTRWRWLPILGTPGLPLEGRLDGDRIPAPHIPGAYTLQIHWPGGSRTFEELTLLVKVPLTEKDHGRVGDYYIGRFPTEGEQRGDRYRAPEGLIRVTPEIQNLRLSEHFTVREFLTHDQADVWPKYVVIDPLVIDKLELVMSDLERHGIPADRMVVMSGFRTPQYNAQGLDDGRATLSRHQYGDAADVWVDNDGDWYMDDLNGDGRRDLGDARVMLAAVERVERAYPQLIGGAGIYRDNGAHGPFIHVDVRGRVARW